MEKGYICLLKNLEQGDYRVMPDNDYKKIIIAMKQFNNG
jgi:hypothetical protein